MEILEAYPLGVLGGCLVGALLRPSHFSIGAAFAVTLGALEIFLKSF